MKQPNHPTVDDAIALLNMLLEIDRDAVNKLFGIYVPCNSALCDHPTVQVKTLTQGLDRSEKFEVSALGLLNGLFGVDEKRLGFITKVLDGFNIVRFQRTPPPAVCSGCHSVIDPDTCGCGEGKEGHGTQMDAGHGFTPMGCGCFRERGGCLG